MDKVGDQLPAIATTVAGLILVFVGMIFTAWDSYEATAKSAVRPKFRRRAWMGFFAFLCAVIAAIFGMVAVGTAHKPIWTDWTSLAFLTVSGSLMTVMAFLAVLEI